MFYTAVQEKNIITFTSDEDGKSYQFDVNTGIMYGMSGKPVKGFPTRFGKFIDDYRGDNLTVYFMAKVRQNPRNFCPNAVANGNYTLRSMSGYEEAVKYLNLIDRIKNIGVQRSDCRWSDLDSDVLEFVNDNFKAFAKYCREHENPSMRRFKDEFGKDKFIQQYHLNNGQLTDSMIDLLYENSYRIDRNDVPYYAYYLARGVYEFCGRYDSINKIWAYLRNCRALGVEPAKGDFFRNYINAQREYDRRKDELDLMALERNYQRKEKALHFETDTLTVVFPKTAQDFENEGRDQHNCVGGYAKRVIAGENYVVFIRRKNDLNTSLITCEVGLNGTIYQFYERYNQSPTSEELIAFRNNYQAHLRENW